jgi:ABC-type glycerol-3-phosphate transport system permease component
MYVSGGLIPYYVILRLKGLLNTIWVVHLPHNAQHVSSSWWESTFSSQSRNPH